MFEDLKSKLATTRIHFYSLPREPESHHINPNGPEAITAIEQLEARVKELEGALKKINTENDNPHHY